jgi:hypothetical protein
MTILRAVAVVVLTAVSGCGGCDSDNDNDTPDAFIIHDAARQCATATTGTLDFTEYDSESYIIWEAPLTSTIASGLTLTYQFEFYAGIEPSLAGTFDLKAGNQANYSSCAICMHAVARDATGKIVKHFFQSAGTVTLTQDPFTTKHMIASFSDLELEEVTLASGYVSTPVAGGECANLADFSADHDQVPNKWTCAHADYDTGTNCDCVCGLPDPDCSINAAPVVGCTTAEPACFNDACVTPPTNDTCASATPIVIGTPVTGSTAGAQRNYSNGLQAATCTNFAQPGPDVVYSLDLTATQVITVTLSNTAATYDGSIALVGPGAAAICDASPITTCVAGADTTFDGQTETFTYTATADGTYYIIVDSFGINEGGTFTLSVTAP